MAMSYADRVWNRACGYYDGVVNERREGDLALRTMLSWHGLVMNGGVFHPFDAPREPQMEEVLRGYRYFGFDAIADLFVRARNLIDSGLDLNGFEDDLNVEYSVHVPDDQVLVDRFERHLAENPELYAPL